MMHLGQHLEALANSEDKRVVVRHEIERSADSARAVRMFMPADE